MTQYSLTKKEENRLKRRCSLVKEHMVKDDMVYQQAILLALANKYFGFTIESPCKLSQITKTLPHILKIHIDEDCIDLNTLAQTHSLSLLQHSLPQHSQIRSTSNSSPIQIQSEGIRKDITQDILPSHKMEIQEKSIQRRIKKNITYFIQNLLIDLCREKGFFFNSLYARKNPNIFQVERIQQIFYKKTFLMEKKQMNLLGNSINDYLLKISNGKTIFIQRNDESLQCILKENFILW